MATAAIWLNTLGTPPPEICLDWTRQLQTHCKAQTLHRVDESTVRELTWQDIEVSETGLLALPPDPETCTAEHLIHQLLAWSKPASAESYTEEHEFAAPELAAETSVAVAVGKPKRTSPAFNLSPFTLVKRYRYATIAAVIVMAVGTGWLALSNSTSQRSKADLAKANDERRSDSLSGQSNAATDNVSDEDLSVANMAPLPSLNDVLGQQDENSVEQTAQTPDIDLSSSMVSNTQAMLSSVNEKSTLDSAEESQSLTPLPIETNDDSEANKGDVMREVAALVETAESQAIETELGAMASEPQAKTEYEPLVLKTSPMIQTHILPSKLARPREPVWSVSLSVDDDFTVQPNEPQRVSARHPATWLISNPDSKPPAAKLAIQAAAIPGRKVGLQWRVAAVSEEIPGLALPLARDSMQFLQRQLLSYIELTRRESNQLSIAGREAEKDVRSLLSKRRTAIDSQNKLASRVAMIAENAQLLDDLLRSQVTLYVTLYEGDKSNAPVLLQFGDPNQSGTETNNESPVIN